MGWGSRVGQSRSGEPGSVGNPPPTSGLRGASSCCRRRLSEPPGARARGGKDGRGLGSQRGLLLLTADARQSHQEHGERGAGHTETAPAAGDTFSVIAGLCQFSSIAQSCPTLCDPMNRSTPGLPVHHQLPEFTQTHIHRVGDAIQPSHPLSSPFPPALNPSQQQSHC